jgi:hypothetical protein
MNTFQQPSQLSSCHFTLPDDKYSPTSFDKKSVGTRVSYDIFLELALPEARIGRWRSGIAALIMPMPEASMHKYDSTVLRQHNVWLTRQILWGNAISQTMSMQILAYNQLRLRVTSPYTGHHPASGCAVHDVCHQAATRKPAAFMKIG